MERGKTSSAYISAGGQFQSTKVNMLENKTHQVWLGQPVVVLGALEAQQRVKTLEVVVVELQLQLLQLVKKWLWQPQQLLREKAKKDKCSFSLISHKILVLPQSVHSSETVFYSSQLLVVPA